MMISYQWIKGRSYGICMVTRELSITINNGGTIDVSTIEYCNFTGNLAGAIDYPNLKIINSVRVPRGQFESDAKTIVR